MTLKISHFKTTRFLDFWSYIPSGIACFLLLFLVFSPSLTKTLVSKTVKVSEEEPLQVATVELKPKELGALRIDVRSFFPDNHWVVYEIQLVDQNGEVVASAMDEAWRESGIWSESGESGIWSESELLGGLDVQSQQTEQLDVVIEVLESGTASGVPADLTASFDVEIKKGVIQSSHLWWGLIFTTILSVLAFLATKVSGNKVIDQTIQDSDPKGRTILGGEDNLIRVKVNTQLDENTPQKVTIYLAINDVNGEQIYKTSRTVSTNLKKNDSGRITGGTGELELFFILPKRESYSFQVKISPDEPVDKTSLVVREGTKTLNSVDVIEISPVV
jgi:hypothetical protein